MSLIKLPGKEKYKKVLLAILVIIALAVIVKEAVINRQDKVVNKDTQIIDSTEQKTEDIEDEEVVEENTEEEQLYNEAYNSFFEGNYNAAIEKANDIINKYPNSYKAYNIRGIAKAFNTGFSEAMEDIDKALEIESDYWYAKYNKAFCYELYGDFDNALIWYDKSLEIEEYMWSYYGKASIYGRKGDVENTVLYLNKAIEVEGCTGEEESGIKTEARTEEDFDPVRDSQEFQDVIK